MARALPPSGVIVADTVTVLGPEARGKVLVAASHGGAYAAYLAARGGVRALVLNDAGIGKDEAGVGALAYGAAMVMAVAVISHDSARIGDGADMLKRGTISRCNALAEACGVRPGMACGPAAARLTAAPMPTGTGAPLGENRRVLETPNGGRRIVLVDSAALVRPEDAGQIVVTGSHGGLVGGTPAKALKVDALAALFNDAGGGADGAGFGRLPALEARGIAAATVDAASARIGEAESTLTDGVLSRVNDPAAALGGRVGLPARIFVETLTKHPSAPAQSFPTASS